MKSNTVNKSKWLKELQGKDKIVHYVSIFIYEDLLC